MTSGSLRVNAPAYTACAYPHASIACELGLKLAKTNFRSVTTTYMWNSKCKKNWRTLVCAQENAMDNTKKKRKKKGEVNRTVRYISIASTLAT